MSAKKLPAGVHHDLSYSSSGFCRTGLGLTDPLRVLMFCPYLGGGGAERHMVRVANSLDRSAFCVSFVVLKAGGSFERDLDTAINVRSLNTRMPIAVPALAQAIRQLQPDVVFSTMDIANCVAIAATYLVRPRPAVVAGIAIAVTVNVANETFVRRLTMRVLIPWLYRRADRIVTPCRGVRDDLIRWIPALADHTQVIYNAGVDENTENLSLQKVSLPAPQMQSPPVVIAVGRLVPQKGFAHLLEAIARLRRRLPAKLWIVGAGPLEGELKLQAQMLGISDSVWFAGFRDNPYALMKHATVFTLASLWEGFAIVVAEAMASGTPVVSTDCPYGPGEIIRNENEGLLVPPGDPGALAAALERVLLDEELRMKMSTAGLQRARDFTAHQSALEHGRLFLELGRARRAWMRGRFGQ